MGSWDIYKSRINSKGGSIRGASLQREVSMLSRKTKNSLSYHTMIINGCKQDVSVKNSDEYGIKTIFSLPDEDIVHGALVFWQDNYWIVTERDVNNEIYTQAKIQQCNYLLKWVNDDNEIIERWSIITDGTKYLIGETISSYNENGMAVGDTRVVMTISKDNETSKLGRKNKFIIDGPMSDHPLSYRLTKPFKLTNVYNGRGTMNFILSEENTTEFDNLDLYIADYYKHFPHEKKTCTTCAEEIQQEGGGDSWI